MKKAKVFQAWHQLDSADALNRAKLSLSDYQILTECLKGLFSGNTVATTAKSVADWCQKQGMKVTLDGCNYRILFDE